ncbi:hypothetical protein BLNAU_23445 [Blattamonas nauphoetae]|uniref:Uncharacterized protein n=1 Tax=Blattamonas nauphoetae TaxID=2049346 RepID=A0ABQ9WQM7_9EUKA|nr:hypothetical protein BLNAU_23445 [Blattamonas nauphoetae]
MVTSVSEGRPRLRSDLHSKSTDKKNEEWKEDSFSLTRRCGFALSRIQQAVVAAGKSLEHANPSHADVKIQLQNQIGGMLFRHFSSVIITPKVEIGEIGIDLAAVRREMEQEREREKRELEDKMRQMEAEREKEKEITRKAEEERQIEFSRKMREMEEMKRMNEKWIEEGRQREEEKKREEERKRKEEEEEEERRRMGKEGAAAIEVFQQDKFTLAGNVFTKIGGYSHFHLLSHSFGAVVVRITFIIRAIGDSFCFGLISTDLTEQAKTAQIVFWNMKGGAVWACYSEHRLVCQNNKRIHKGSACKAGVVGQRVVMEADGREGKRTLKMSQDGETQPTFFSIIPVPFRFAFCPYKEGTAVEIVSTNVLREPSLVGGSVEVVMD